MTKEEAIKKLLEIQKSVDIEIAHGDADDVLCDLLISLGYEDVVIEYNAIEKWYA